MEKLRNTLACESGRRDVCGHQCRHWDVDTISEIYGGAQAVCLELFAQSKPFRYFFAFFDLLCQMGGK